MKITKKWIRNILVIFVIVCVVFTFEYIHDSNEIIELNIGYQSITAQTWGALIMKNQKLLEKQLKECYPDKVIEIRWYDEMSGSVINNNMLAHKYQIGYMGDMACIINLYNGYIQENYVSELIVFDGKGEAGINQSILVSKDSNMKSIEDLANKTISVPVGSSAHRMLLEILENNCLMDSVHIVHQDIPTACNMVMTGKVDAMAAWEPYPTAMEWEGKMTELINGEESGKDYLAGIVVDKNWADDNEKILDILQECIRDSHEFIKEHQDESIKIICDESSFSPEVVSSVLDCIDWDDTISDKDMNTLVEDSEFLKSAGEIESFPILQYIKNEK